MSTNSKFPFRGFGELLVSLRQSAGIGKQVEFAKLVKSTQQTVSRWERGVSRPRDKQLPLIASVLKADIAPLLAAAGYTRRRAIATFDQPFPVDALSPDSFERFCMYLLHKLHPTARVIEPAGKDTHKMVLISS